MLRLYDLKVNERFAPMGIAAPEYFAWRLESDHTHVVQIAYRIEIPGLWDSGRVESRQQAYVPYEGIQITASGIYLWRVTVWDNQGETAIAESTFESACVDWQAQWVSCSFTREPGITGIFGASYPAVMFKRRVELRDVPIQSARLYATAIGVYRAEINGRRLDDRELAPEFTTYDKIQYVQTYDVTAQLHSGKNTLTMLTADGWYFNAQLCPILEMRHPEPAVLYQLEVTYTDGGMSRFFSDGSETACTGAIQYADLFIGEKEDLRIPYNQEQPVRLCDYGYEQLVPQPSEPIVPVMTLPAVQVLTTPKGETVVDFGQIISGRARIHLHVPAGTEVQFAYFEVLDADGNYLNTMFAPQTDIIVSAGKPVDYEAKFTFHGFRYIKVTGIPEVRSEDFTAVVLSTKKESTGDFTCSEPQLNRLYQNIRWSQRNNMMCVPSDCPTREKAGWTGDLLIYAPTALLNENVTPLLTAWLRNVRADMSENGVVRIVSPFERLYDVLLKKQCAVWGDGEQNNVAGWSDAIVWVPWAMYQATGNKAILEENFQAMASYCQNLIRAAEKESWLPTAGFHFGEWLIPSEPTADEFAHCRNTVPYIVPFFTYETLRKMAAICKTLDNDDAPYVNAAEQVKQAIFQQPAHPEKMGAYVLAFAFDLVPEGKRQAYRKKLAHMIHENNDCLDTGFLATPFLLDVLCDIGESTLAQALLWQNERPSWLYEVEHGATAIWEAWDADDAQRGGRFVSFDHYAFGCVDDFICRRLCGIQADAQGYAHVTIAPMADPHITTFSRTLMIPAGRIRITQQENALTVELPANVTAIVHWHGQQHAIGSGRYTFS